jgi:hypothetical protein
MKSNILSNERAAVIENTGFRWAFVVLAFGLLLDVAYRGFMLNQPSWDILGLIVLSGLIATFYQVSHKLVVSRWFLRGLVAVTTAGVVTLILFAAKFIQ